MTEKENSKLEQLNDEQYNNFINNTNDRFSRLFKGELVIDRKKDVLIKLKKSIQKAIDLKYSYTDIAKFISDNDDGISFSAHQIKTFCEENYIGKNETVKKSRKALNAKADNKDTEDLIEKRHFNDEDVAEI